MEFVAKHKPLHRHNVGCQKSEKKSLLSRSKGVGARMMGEPVSVRLLRVHSERQSLHCYCNACTTKINLNTVLVVLMHLLCIIIHNYTYMSVCMLSCQCIMYYVHVVFTTFTHSYFYHLCVL